MEVNADERIAKMAQRRRSLPYMPPEEYFPLLPIEIVGTYSNHGANLMASDQTNHALN